MRRDAGERRGRRRAPRRAAEAASQIERRQGRAISAAKLVCENVNARASQQERRHQRARDRLALGGRRQAIHAPTATIASAR